uniref:Coiled-coil domain-containing protein 43 n=1 Tax=Lates calcarifer TaxID=8187 RepID=A0A4W6CQT7_LATCA
MLVFFKPFFTGSHKGQPFAIERPQRTKMAAPETDTGEFERWLNDRLDSLEVDREVYGAYILGVLQEEESDEEKEDALQGILSAFLDEDTVEDVCKQIIKQWTECCNRSSAKRSADDAEVQAIASMIEKQAQIVVKQKEVSEETKKRKEALLAQYANVTDEEDEAEDEEAPSGNHIAGNEKCILSEAVYDQRLYKIMWNSCRILNTQHHHHHPIIYTSMVVICSNNTLAEYFCCHPAVLYSKCQLCSRTPTWKRC